MASLNRSQTTSVAIENINCNTFEEVKDAIDKLRPKFSAVFREAYRNNSEQIELTFTATQESFAQAGYFGGPRTVHWVEGLDHTMGTNGLGFNESGTNLIYNLSDRANNSKSANPETRPDIIVQRDHEDELDAWKAAFSDDYIDPYGCVNDLVDVLRKNITDFCAHPDHYIAPYTCIVTSSMMGKSRLMKEISAYIPTVYMCLGTNRNLYPHPTKVVVEWMRGGVEGMGYWHPSDGDFLIPTLKYCAFLLALIQALPIIVKKHSDEKDYSWMWKFFAEPPKDCEEINEFWIEVTLNATSILRKKSSFSGESLQKFSSPPQILSTPQTFSSPQKSAPQKPSTPQKPSSTQEPSTPQKPSMSQMFSIPLTPPGVRTYSAPQSPDPRQSLSSSQQNKKNSVSAEAVRIYLAEKFGDEFHDAYNNLKEAFNIIDDKDFDMLLIFDEARYLTDTSAIDGKQIPSQAEYHEEANAETEKGPSDPKIMTEFFPFSNFRALRRALHFFMLTRESHKSLNSPVPRIFGLMTDTSSRLANFQPTLWEDNSLKVNQLPPMGPKQFDPIFVFTSIDIHSRISNNTMCISDVDEIALVDRLMKFGRPGWWSIHHHYPGKKMLEFAASKLTGIQKAPDRLFGIQLVANVDDKTRLRLFSVLAPRLAITSGPYTREAAEAVASHLAIVIGADHRRHFLRTVYPSEPIVAAASASLTARINGWPNTLNALTHFVQTGIVDAGFRGELLTKILCLMAIDKSMGAVSSRSEGYWEYAVPVKVSVFLDNLIAAPPGFKTFSDALRATPIHDERLNEFLEGHVFFNHFIQMTEKLTMPLILQALNRGAGLMCKGMTSKIDHFIPVILAKPHASPPSYGPLYDDWNGIQVEAARRNVSGIAINSKNFTDSKNWTNTYITPCNANITDWESPPEVENNKLWLTISQEFGPKQNQEDHITIFPSRGEKTQLQDTTQLHVILKELCKETYTGFRNNYIHPLAQDYLLNLRVASGNYSVGADDKVNSICNDNMPVMLGDYTPTSKQTWRTYLENRMQVDE